MSATPKVVLDAFVPAVVAVGTIRLQHVTAAHWLALEKVQSVFVNITPDEEMVPLEELIKAIYVLHIPAEEVLDAVADPVFQRKLNAFTGRIDLRHTEGLLAKLSAHLKSAFSTRIVSEEAGSDDGVDRPFVETSSKRAAAGCSTQSPNVVPGTAGQSSTQ